MRKSGMLIGAFAMVNFMDYFTTLSGVEMGFHEVNSLVASLTPFSFLLLKILIVLSISILVLKLRKLNSPLMRGIYLGLLAGVLISTLVLTVVALHNLLLIAGFEQLNFLVEIMSRILI